MDCKKFSGSVLKNWKDKKAVNPNTNRKIGFWTNTFNRIENECNVYNDCKSIKGMKNIDAFSCYLDSVLFILLIIPNKHIDKALLHKKLNIHNVGNVCFKKDSQKNLEAAILIQDELQKISFSIRNGKHIGSHTCRDFLKIIKRYCKESSYPKFYASEQRAPNDFIEFIFDLFHVDRYFKNEIVVKNIYKKKHYSPILKAFTSQTITKNAHCIWNVPNELIKPETHLKKYLRIGDVSRYDKNDPLFLQADKAKQNPILYMKATRSFKKLPPFLVFEITRVQVMTGAFNDSNIIPDPYIKNLSLYGIIVHIGYTEPSDPIDLLSGGIGSGHYVAYFKCKGEWYKYDDLQNEVSYIGSYNDLIAKTEVCSNGTLYFYST